jgi:hypothetical protein
MPDGTINVIGTGLGFHTSLTHSTSTPSAALPNTMDPMLATTGVELELSKEAPSPRIAHFYQRQ